MKGDEEACPDCSIHRQAATVSQIQRISMREVQRDGPGELCLTLLPGFPAASPVFDALVDK